MTISTHVLDATSGRPADGVSVTLYDASGTPLCTATTDADGRIGGLATDPGVHRLRFDTGRYFRDRDTPTFYPDVTIAFEVTDPAATYHVPLLMSPFAFSTYRGS